MAFIHKFINYKQRQAGQQSQTIDPNFKLIIISVSLMDLNEVARPKKVYNVIEPNTVRVLEMRRKNELIILQKRTQQQKLKKKREEDQRKNASLLKMRDDEQRIARKMIEDAERRERELQKESNTLTGRFGHMINDLNTNTTNLQFTISGMDLRPAQIKVLISNVQNNSSLKGLTMCRKKLTEVEGIDIADKLLDNQFLERLELQGNLLGSDTLTHIAILLFSNESIRMIDLEGNTITRGPDDKLNYSGIDKLAEALENNETLLSLNLNNNGLDGYCSNKLREVMESNSTLIHLDLQNNPEMNIEDVLVIQDSLMKNKQNYDDQKYMEFIERKRMRREEDISGVLLLNAQTKKLRSQAIDLNIKTKKAQLDEEWNQYLASEQLKKQKEIIRMEKDAAASKKSKKKKK